MPPVDRNNPQRAESSESSYSLMEFMSEYPNDAACLRWLWRERCSEDGEHAECPKCDRTRKFHKVAERPAWDCDTCGYHMHPTAGTIFHKSSTSLHLWFFAMHLITSTRGGISAKQLERELGVTYKTAWRMFNLIRNELMAQDGSTKLRGAVEADETAWGGRPKVSMTRGMTMSEAQKFAKARKVSIVAVVERGERGRVRAYVEPRDGALETVSLHVDTTATVYTDEWAGYKSLHATHPKHHTINHSDRVYAIQGTHTQTIDGFFGNMKRGISGVYHNVSHKWLQGYVNEYTWRYNHRSDPHPMFLTLLARAADDVA